MTRLLRRGMVLGLLAVWVVGCGPATLDTSSARTAEHTAHKMRDAMTERELQIFDEALFYLAGMPWLGKDEGDQVLVDDQIEALMPLHGRTGAGIVAEARRRRLAEVRSGIAELEGLRATFRAARTDLDAFRFSQARVYKIHRGYLEWPVIEFRLVNETNHLVSLVNFRAVLLKPGLDQPWLMEEFDLVFFDGLAPGENGRWRIEPKQQEWIHVADPHPDLEFLIEARRLEAIGGRVLSSSDWGVVEARRLARFERTLKKIRSSDSLALDQPPLPSLPPLALEELAEAGTSPADGQVG